MSKFPLPWLALGAGVLIALLLLMSMQAGPDAAPLPLLTQLLLAEFGFVLNVIGVWLGWRDLQRKGRTTAGLLVLAGCVLMALLLALLGLSLWPEGGLAPPAQ
jgi:hypothetical protein